MPSDIPIRPEQASTIAGSVDALFVYLLAVTFLLASVVFILIFYFAVKYRRRPDRAAVQIEVNLWLELIWTLIPLGLAAVMFIWGAAVYMKMQEPPANALDIYIVGKQWMWTVQHPEGRREIDQLHV